MSYVHATPLAVLMLSAQRQLQHTLPPPWMHGKHAVRLSPLDTMRAASLRQRAEFDRWRAETLLQLTTAANDEPAEPAQA